MTALGPFEVAGDQIERLDEAFTEFVNRLLRAETSRARLAGHKLLVTSQEYTPDGGVDALLENNHTDTKWVPSGTSAWQFKRGRLSDQECREELRKPFARDLVAAGAHYRLVLGRRLNALEIQSRRTALTEEGKDLGLISEGDEERIHVLDANALADWASNVPSLAIAPFMHGPGTDARTFDYWSESRHHQYAWTATPEREGVIENIRKALLDPSIHEIRVQGVSGVGKTRLAMEALRTEDFRPLVAYVRDASFVGGGLVGYLASESRACILVVDECRGRDHDKLAESIPASSTIKLITIGPPDGHPVRSPLFALPPMPEDGIEEFLKTNFPQLFVEARRFIVENCAGNAGFAIVLAGRIQDLGEGQAAELISKDDVEAFLAVVLPEGKHPFFLSSILALADRVGWDRDRRSQLESLAEFVGVPPEEFEELGHDLEARGLLARQGRYRSIVPHPVAIVLAASAWRSLRSRIVDELLPRVDRELALAIFKRVADLGSYEPAQSVLLELMASDGPLGTLDSIEAHELGEFLVQLAIVAPEATTRHLSLLIEGEPLDGLRAQTRSRRDLVWSLEKLVWHRSTFEMAADSLLRLALAENESYGNNATGTWLGLFGAVLPATAATPDQRLAYLKALASSDEEAVRLLVVQACAGAMHPYESAMVSGERQEGRLVEPRGGVRNHEEAAEYRVALIDLMARLCHDPVPAVSSEAAKGLVGAIHPLIDHPAIRDRLVQAILALEPEDLTLVRREVEKLRGLYLDVEGRPATKAALEELAQLLPKADVLERLRVLLGISPWEVERRDHAGEISDLVSEVIASNQLDIVLGWLSANGQFPSAWQLGHALAKYQVELPHLLDNLVSLAEVDATVLGGFLQGLVDEGSMAAFDDFLDSDRAGALDLRTVLALTVRGPPTEAARQRVARLLEELPTHEGARLLFGWQRNVDVEDARLLIDRWSGRIASQDDYNAVLDWVRLWLPRGDDLPDAVRDVVWDLLKLRLEYPALSRESWDWGALAALFVEERPHELAVTILELISDDKALYIRGEQEAELLCAAAREKPNDVWAEVARRLEAGDWRIDMTLRAWFTDCVPTDVLSEWVGDSLERGRILSSIASVGTDEPSDLTFFLLDRFGDDERITSALAAEFMSGTWTGPESGRLSSQITQLEGWLKAEVPRQVKTWAIRMIESLERSREDALEREAERGF